MDQDWKREAKALFNRITPIPEEEWEKALACLSVQSFEKNRMLLSAGDLAPHSFLLLKGLVKIYYLLENGKEYISGFAHEGQFCGSVTSIIGGHPSRFYIQALEPVRAVLLPRPCILQLYDGHRCWDRLGRIISEGVMMLYEAKEGQVMDSLEDRYLLLLRHFPDLTRRVPQYSIASFLGVTGVALSRVRKKLKERGILPENEPEVNPG